MTDMTVEIMVEVLAILAIATNEVKRRQLSVLNVECVKYPVYSLFLADSCLEKYFRRLIKYRDLEDSLEKLDSLTQEARMASTELLKMTHSVDGEVMGEDDKVKGVEKKMQDANLLNYRKLSGAFLLASRLRATVDCKRLWDDVIDSYKFSTDV